jgi:hypothetical protein
MSSSKGKKTKGSSSSCEEKTPHLKRMSPKRERTEKIAISLPTTKCF